MSLTNKELFYIKLKQVIVNYDNFWWLINVEDAHRIDRVKTKSTYEELTKIINELGPTSNFDGKLLTNLIIFENKYCFRKK